MSTLVERIKSHTEERNATLCKNCHKAMEGAILAVESALPACMFLRTTMELDLVTCKKIADRVLKGEPFLSVVIDLKIYQP